MLSHMNSSQLPCRTLHLPDAADQNTTAVIAGKSSSLHCDANLPLSTYKPSINPSLRRIIVFHSI